MIIQKRNILNELIKNQRKNIPNEVLFNYKDLNRIANNIDKSIFGNECSIWKGFIHHYKNNYYINFFFKGSKKNLSRLLYYNFVGNIDNYEYIKNICENVGKCCNITHYKKCTKNIDDIDSDSDNENDDNNKNDNNDDSDNENDDNNKNDNNDDNDDNNNIIDEFKITF